jgi:hypothetical protein
MRTTVDLDRHLLRRLRDDAHREGIPFKEALNRAVRRGLEVRAAADELYACPVFTMGAPLRSLDRALALADALEEEEVARKLALRK